MEQVIKKEVIKKENPVSELIDEAKELEKKAARLRERAKEVLPEIATELAKELWENVKDWDIDPKMLANEILYVSGARHRPGYFLTDETGTERYTKGPVRYAPWLAEMQKDPNYSTLEHYKMSMKFAYEEDIPFFEKKIKKLERDEEQGRKYREKMARKDAEEAEKQESKS